MHKHYKAYHYVISIIISIIGFIFTLGYVWTTYGTIVHRGGMNYSGYFYYDVSKEFWVFYLIIMTLISLAIPTILFLLFLKKASAKSIYFVWISFLIIFLIEKACLIFFYVGKG